MTLDEIGIKHGTDKASLHPEITGHNYCIYYEQFFSHLRYSPIRLLEIGVGGANSIKMWLEYFSIAQVVGVDNNPEAAKVDSPRYEFSLTDQGSADSWKIFNELYPLQWDIIIDDGGHEYGLMKPSWECLWPRLKPGGFYVIEDVHVYYQGEPNPGKDWLHSLAADVHASRRPDLEWIHQSTALFVIKKRW